MIVSPAITIEKSLGEGRFAGLAWSFLDTPDREGDVILPSALESAAKAIRLPEVRVEHRKGDVAGAITTMRMSDRGLEVEGQVDTGTAVGRKAYGELRERELGALSMGFRGIAETSGHTRVFTSIAIDEISLCREPMNVGSRIHAVKSWGQVGTQRDLERLLHDVAGMPNRLARKSAELVWPALSTEDDEAAAASRLADRIAQITNSVRD